MLANDLADTLEQTAIINRQDGLERFLADVRAGPGADLGPPPNTDLWSPEKRAGLDRFIQDIRRKAQSTESEGQDDD